MKPLLAAAALFALGTASLAAEPFIVVQSTTSTQNSGLYAAILPQFTQVSGIAVRVVAVGTGQALRNARNCDGDLLITHAPAQEETFVAEGYGLARFDLMYNDFVLVGPKEDPAGIAQTPSASAALTRIAQAEARFASRGDSSGTHLAEQALWKDAGLSPELASGTWYLETGSGMGATLNLAVARQAYALTDRASWISFGNKGSHGVLSEGDPALFNQYGVIVVNPAACANTKRAEAQALADWLLSAKGQTAIAAYHVQGTQLFFPNAAP